MKQYNKVLALVMGVCLSDMTPSLAASTSASSDSAQASLESAIQKVNLQTAELQKEVKRLRAELQKMKRDKQSVQHNHAPSVAAVDQTANNTAASSPISNTFANIPKLLAAPVIHASLPNVSLDLDPSAFISYQNGMSQGLFFLQQRQALEKLLQGAPLPSVTKPQVIFSGKLEAQGIQRAPYNGPASSSIDLVTAEIDTYAEVSPWASGFMAIAYNNASLNQVLVGSGDPVNNSNIFLNRGYITLGNLSKSPIYFNIGQMYVPFGAYSSYMLTNPVTKVLSRTNTRAAELGYSKEGFNVSGYVFNGAANVGNTTVDNWGANSAYSFNFGEYSGNVGVGFINNIANAQGAQLTGGGNGTFAGFSQNPVTETIVHYVPGVNVNAFLGRGPLYFAAEGTAATREYDQTDMSYNGTGAQPKAAHLELGYIFKAFEKRTVFSVAYEQTWEALAMGLPKNSYVATLNTSIWKNTVETLEFRHDVNYAAGDTGNGACGNSGNMLMICPGPVASGGQQNAILAQLGIYF